MKMLIKTKRKSKAGHKYPITEKVCTNDQFTEAIKASHTLAECAKILNIKNTYYYDFYGKIKELQIDASHLRKKEQIKLKPGMKINRLTIIEMSSRRRNKRYWLCKCDCGRQKNIMGSHITSAQSQSCGCLTKQVKSHGRNPLCFTIGELHSTKYSRMRANAKSREIEFNVNIEYLWDLYLKQDRKCKLSGRPIRFYKDSGPKGDDHASLDRIDSKKGYIEGNVQWTNKRVNMMRNNMTNEEFIGLCQEVCDHNKKDDGV